MVGKVDIIKDKWEKNKERNLAFWRGKGHKVRMSFNYSFKLWDYFGPMIGDKKEVSIVDIGSGIISTTGSTWRGVKVDLHPCDIWADEYAEIHKGWRDQYGRVVKPIFPIEKQDMEKLTYKDEMFDIVHCNNALDHCIDPYKALKEMYRVCKKGGWIYLRHIPNEGVNNRYGMQHQWNITKQEDDCLIWNYQEGFYLSSVIEGFKNVEKEETPDVTITVVSTLQK